MGTLSAVDLMIMQQAFGLAVYGCLGVWYVWPWLRDKAPRVAVPIAMLPFVFRFVGGANAVPGVVGPGYPMDAAMMVVIGDAVCAALALATIGSYRAGWRIGPALAWLTVAESVGYSIVYAATSDLQAIIENLHAHWYVGAVYVPLLTLNNILVAALLLRARRPRSEAMT